ncbi:MAG: hypothetical protein IJ019_00570 [Alphaproteobacteria bacterium]|nr:hypothetical protein [Alphaproteobacteria bacterium]
MSLNRKFRAIVALITVVCFSYNSYAASSQVVDSLYNYAHNKQVSKIKYMLNTMGYDIDVEDEDGVTAWCLAKESNDTCAMGVLEQMGADTEQRCGLPWGYIGAAAGVVAVGGAIAAAAGGGGGGSDPCSGVVCGDNEHCLKGQCVCNAGFLEFDDVCYPDLNCSAQKNSDGKQYKDACNCINGFSGNLCTECTGVLGNDGICYEKLDCGQEHQGYQQNGACICINDYSGTDCQTCNGHDESQTCWEKLDCGDNGYQKNNECHCENGYTGENCRTCDGQIGIDGKCYPTATCLNGGYQINDGCKCINGYTGVLCETCNGYEENGTCWEKLECGDHGTQKNDMCVCKDGYSGSDCTTCTGYVGADDGICYSDVRCANGGTQVGGVCDCTNANGYSGTYCDVCEGVVQNGICYEKKECQNGDQVANECVCDKNWDGELCDVCPTYLQDGICYDKVECQNGGTQDKYGCDCTNANGYSGELCDVCAGTKQGSVCYPTLTCNNGTQVENRCECYEGYDGADCTECATGYDHYGDETQCYKTLESEDCVHGSQQGNNCVCEGYWSGTKCDTCTGVEQDGACYQTLECGEHGTQVGNTCECEENYYRDGTGKCVSSSDAVTMNTFDGNNNYMFNESVSKTQQNYGDVYGLVYDADPANPTNHITGDQYDMYINYLDNEEESDEVKNTRTLTLNNLGDGNVYGVYSKNAENMYLTYLDLQAAVTQGTQTTNLTINNGGEIVGTQGLVSGGNGEVYGIWSTGSTDVYNMAQDLGTDIDNTVNMSSEINISGIGTGDLYGMYNNEYGNLNNGLYDVVEDKNIITDNAVINVESKGSGTVYGMRSYGGNIINSGVVDVSSASGDAHGIYVDDLGDVLNLHKVIVEGNKSDATGIDNRGYGDVTNSGTVDVSGNTSSMWGIFSSSGLVSNQGTVTVTNNSGSVSGIHASDSSVENSGAITVSNTGDNPAYGIYTTNNSVENSGDITVSNTGDGTAYGIYASEGASVENTKNVTVSSTSGSAYGIYSSGGNVTNSGTIKVTGTDGNIFGIYATYGATVTNTNTIILNTESCDGTTCDGSATYNNFIVLDNGAVYVNRGVTQTSLSLDFDDNNGTVALGKDGVFKASALNGTMAIDTSVVESGFEDAYVEVDALQSSNINVNAVSNSAMFDASVQKNGDKDSANVVLTRKSFDDLSASSSIAKFLETNYNQQNNESLFAELKRASTHTYSAVEASNLGYGLIPNFAHENLNVLRNLNSTLNDELFETTGALRKMVGYDYLYQSRDTKGTLTGYENYANTMYFMYDKENDNLLRTGLGMSITQFSSDYDDDSSRKEVMAQVLVPVSYIENNMSYASIARFGYADGEYERQTPNGKFESDLTSWIYGLSNQARYNMDLGFMEIEPTAEFNVLGYYQNRIRENKDKIGSIKADGENNLSVEAGLGLSAKKDVEFDTNNKLSFKASAMYYHEFAKPYHSLNASLNGMDGTYKITDYENIYDRDRGMLSLGVDYRYKPFTFYGKFRQFIEDENPFEANAGVKYNF